MSCIDLNGSLLNTFSVPTSTRSTRMKLSTQQVGCWSFLRLVRTPLLLLTPDKEGISPLCKVEQNISNNKKKKIITQRGRKKRQNTVLWIAKCKKARSGACFGTMCVLCMAIARTQRKSNTATTAINPFLRSDPGLCWAITFIDPMMPSDCSRPFSPKSLSKTPRLLDSFSIWLYLRLDCTAPLPELDSQA